jgi:signal transduction histidine kinase
MIKLLHKTQQVYIIYLIIIFLIIAPLFYFTTKKLYLEDTQETLKLNKDRFVKQILPDFKIKDIKTWNKYNPDNLILINNSSLKKDSIFSTFFYNILENEYEPYCVLYSPIKIENKPYLYTAKINLVESEDLILNIAILFISLVILLMSGMLVITQRLSKSIWKPFYSLINQIENFEIDKYTLPEFAPTNIEEFNRLNKAIEILINRNIKIYNTQREFIDNAAHELQTPLAIFRSNIDLLIQSENLTTKQAQIITTINKNIDKLIKLNKNLLILSKIDRNTEIEVEQFNLNEILEKQISFFKEQANAKQVNFQYKCENNILVTANKNLTEILCSNLLLNALQHNIDNGIVSVEIKQNRLIVSNTSNQPEITNDRLFNRFAKSPQNKQGNGLGLAIVKKIIDQNNWKISYMHSENWHFFTVEF